MTQIFSSKRMKTEPGSSKTLKFWNHISNVETEQKRKQKIK